MNHLQLLPYLQGSHAKVPSLLEDEELRSLCVEHLRDASVETVAPKMLMTFMNATLPTLQLHRVSVSLSTATRYLHALGYNQSAVKNGIYVDGHERENVVEYRAEFVKKMLMYQKYMKSYEGIELMENGPIDVSEKRHVLVTHDESIFVTNDGVKSFWSNGEKSVLRKKGNGRSLMVSELLCECHGVLKTEMHGHARVIIKPGKDYDGWWTCENLIQQVKSKAIPIFEELHPNCIAVFAFDNSMNHLKRPEDGLDVNKHNLSDGGKRGRKVIRDGWFFSGDERVVQKMQRDDGVVKSIRTILMERGLWENGMKLDHGRKLLSYQDDFKQQKSILEETVVDAGHKFVLYSKFHCELNFIELYWAAAKRKIRQRTDFTFSGLEAELPKVLDLISVDEIRRYARFCWRYMDAYSKGLDSKKAAYAAKKYTSHRRIPVDVIDQL